jgi:mannonate dehydratase
VANEYKIRMACHPQDPGVPPEGYQGVNRVLAARGASLDTFPKELSGIHGSHS